MRHKFEVLDVLLNWKKMIETKTGIKMKRIKSDK